MKILKIGDQVTVLHYKTGEPLTVGIIESFPEIIRPADEGGNLESIKVREPDGRSIITRNVRPWQEGDPPLTPDPEIKAAPTAPAPDDLEIKAAWHLFRVNGSSTEVLVDTFSPPDGQDVMGCDMDEWMRENDHYGDESPEDYEWDGDREYVAVMAKREGMPEFCFRWQPVCDLEIEAAPVPVLQSSDEVCRHLEAEDEDTAKKHVYEYTECGAWIEFDEDGIRLGSIVEGTEATTESFELKYPFSVEDYDNTIAEIEAQVDTILEEEEEE